jgi:hypothetical protein
MYGCMANQRERMTKTHRYTQTNVSRLTRQGKARQDKTRQDKTRQGKTRQEDKTRQKGGYKDKDKENGEGKRKEEEARLEDNGTRRRA